MNNFPLSDVIQKKPVFNILFTTKTTDTNILVIVFAYCLTRTHGAVGRVVIISHDNLSLMFTDFMVASGYYYCRKLQLSLLQIGGSGEDIRDIRREKELKIPSPISTT